MFPQAHLIGQNYSVYYDLAAVIVFLFLCMALCSVPLIRQKRSYCFLSLVWLGFVVLTLLGALGLITSIHAQRFIWRDSCSRLVASYANFVSNLNHEKIQPGNPKVFSDWSLPIILPEPNHSNIVSHDDSTYSEAAPSTEKLAVPRGLSSRWEQWTPSSNVQKKTQFLRRNQWAVAELTQNSQAFENCLWQIVVQWNTAPTATTYRLQWGEFDGENTKWMTVYTGSKPSCILSAPEGKTIALRVRAEDGTPEDDPDFNQIINILDFPVKANDIVGYAYTIRFVDQQSAQYVASPISDGNHNGSIDSKEMPNDIGESCPVDVLFRYVNEHKERAMWLEKFTDQWGEWLTIAEPLRTAEGKIDGIFAMDFDARLVYRQMFIEQIYPICLFTLVAFFYMGVVMFVNHLQLRAKKISRLANELQVTVLELTEAKHAAEKALQARTLFLTNVSHEFRTPLNAILGFTEIISRRIQQCVSEERGICQEAVKHMNEGGKHLLELIDNVLGVAAMNEDQSLVLTFEPVRLRSLVKDIAELLHNRAASKSLTLMVAEQEKVPEWIESSTIHIRQILIQLIGNAIKFTEDGGISICYGIAQRPYSPTIPMYYISVSDTGIGIDTAYLESIFKPFSQSDPMFTRKYGGIGIGLSVARQAAEMLNGNISVKSALGEGSTFTFTFPARLSNPGLKKEEND